MQQNETQNLEESSSNYVEVIGFGKRFVAIIIDGVFILFVSLLIAFLIGFVMVVLDWFVPVSEWPIRILIASSIFLVSLIYYSGKWMHTSGQTFGKFLLGIRIISKDGSPLTTSKMLLRYLGYYVSSLFASLGFIWVAVDKKRRGWHDMIAGTYVVSILHEYPTSDEMKIVPNDVGKNWVWIVLWVLLALGTPATVISGLWFLGPIAANILNGFGK